MSTPKTPTTKAQTKGQNQAQKTTASAKAATKQAERTARTIVLDGAYATLGLTDSALAVVKELPTRATRLRQEAPKRAKSVSETAKVAGETAPKAITERLQALRSQASSGLDAYAGRGRKVANSLRRSVVTQRAVDQSRVARTQVKAAATSVRKAVVQSGAAAENAVERTGQRSTG